MQKKIPVIPGPLILFPSFLYKDGLEKICKKSYTTIGAVILYSPAFTQKILNIEDFESAPAAFRGRIILLTSHYPPSIFFFGSFNFILRDEPSGSLQNFFGGPGVLKTKKHSSHKASRRAPGAQHKTPLPTQVHCSPHLTG